MRALKRLFRRVFCKHQYAFRRNLYGDEIIEWGWKRSIWQCEHCGNLQGRDSLHTGNNVA